MKSFSNSVTKFYNQKICEKFYFSVTNFSLDFAFPSSALKKMCEGERKFNFITYAWFRHPPHHHRRLHEHRTSLGQCQPWLVQGTS